MNFTHITLSALLLLSSTVSLADGDRHQGEGRRGGDRIGFPQQDPRFPQQDPRFPQQDPRFPQQDPRFPQQDPRFPQQDPRFPQPYPMPMPAPRNEIVRQQVNERITDEGGIELFRLLGLGMTRQGQVIKRVTITGRSDRGFGMADLQVNGQLTSAPQRLSDYSNTLTFDLPQGLRIGQEIRSLQIHLRGMIQIDEVSIEIDNQSGRPDSRSPERIQRRFEQVINQRLYDTNGVELSRLAMIPTNLDNQIVDSVELTLRNGDMGTKLSLCQTQMGQYQRIDCGAQVFVSQGRQIVRLTLPAGARLREISLAVRMGMIDIDSMAINFR